MKKTLLATTALVMGGAVMAATPAAAAEKIKLGLGGFMEQWIGYVDEDQEGAVDVDQKSDSEWYIRGSTKLDNGIEISVKWEIEGEAESIDGESHYDEGPTASVIGSFGRLDLGRNDTASENLGYGARSYGAVGLNKSDLFGDWVRRPTGHDEGNFTHSLDLGMDDDHMVTYYTPRIAGFQAGASYVPNGESAGENPVAETDNAHNGIFFGANWVGKFGGFGLAFSAGYGMAEDDDDLAGAGDDPEGYAVGGRITFANFEVSGGYLVESDLGAQAGDDTSYNASVAYVMGANKFSLGGHWSQGDVNGGGEDETTIYELGYSRVLGPGVDWASSLGWVEFDGAGSGVGTEDNDGWVAVTGLRLSF